MRHATEFRIISFSYRRGASPKANVVFDVRFLPNPHYVASLRPFSGRDPRVARFVLGKPETRTFLKHVRPLLRLMLKRRSTAKRGSFCIAFGCTGGKHRSVAIAESVARDLNRWGYPAKVTHRDLRSEP